MNYCRYLYRVIQTTRKRCFSRKRWIRSRCGKKLDDYIGVKLLLENIFKLCSGPEVGFVRGSKLYFEIFSFFYSIWNARRWQWETNLASTDLFNELYTGSDPLYKSESEVTTLPLCSCAVFYVGSCRTFSYLDLSELNRAFDHKIRSIQ